MLNKSIAYRLSIYISLSVIIVFIAFITIYFLFNQRLIKENVQNEAIGKSAEVMGNVNKHVVATKEVTDNVARQIYFYLEHGHAEDFIGGLLQKYTFLNAIHINIDVKSSNIKHHHYYCFPQGDSVKHIKRNVRIRTCISKEKSLAKIQERKKHDWTEPFYCQRNDNVVVSYYAPVMHSYHGEEPRHVGDVVCELSLLELNESINGIEIGDHGYAFLITREGNYITHPNKDLILNRNVFNLPPNTLRNSNVDLDKIFSEGLTGSVIAYPDYLNYEKAWVYHTPIKESGWMLIFVQPYRELFEPLYLPVLQMLFFSVMGILVIYLLVTYITNKQIQPLSSITQQLKTFSTVTGDSDDIPANEVEQVSESLNYMKSWYEKYKLSQSKEAEKSKIRKRDIRQASEIQRSFVKTDYPAFPGRTDIDLFALYKPAQGVSGDLFDYFFIDEEHLVFTIGDVSGKGVPAAFFMSVAQTIIKKNAIKTSARDIVTFVNKELYTTNQHQFFLTLFLGVFNVKTGLLKYCNAAHTAPYVLKGNGELLELAQSHGLPLGLYSDKLYEEAEINLSIGDSIVLYTDGVTELNDASNLQYSNERLEENLKSLQGHTPREMVHRIEKSLKIFIGDAIQSDDISLLILRYNGKQANDL